MPFLDLLRLEDGAVIPVYELDGIFVFRIYEYDILVSLVRCADRAGERVGSVGEATVCVTANRR